MTDISRIRLVDEIARRHAGPLCGDEGGAEVIWLTGTVRAEASGLGWFFL
jgi:hypothetical protein